MKIVNRMLNLNTTTSEIIDMLSSVEADETAIISFENDIHEPILFNRHKNSYFKTIEIIKNIFSDLANEMAEVYAETEPSDDDIDAMYAAYIAQEENCFECEDAIMHHCFC